MLPRREGRGLARREREGRGRGRVEWGRNEGEEVEERENERTWEKERERMGWEIGRRWGGDLSEVKSWKCSMAVENR